MSPLCLLAGLLLLCSGEGKIHWGYTGKYGVDRWADLFPECNGTSQSPVDIVTASQIPDNSLTAFTFMNFDTVEDIQWVLQNNGHSAQVTYSDGNLLVGGGGLGSRYKVVQFHFHWGANNSVGSEHTIDGQPFPMEMHIVTYNINYEDMGSAALYKDGLAVLGVFFMVDPSDNSNYTKLIRALGEVQKPDTQVQVMPVELESLMPNDKSKYSRYSGSLTTPPCSEVVTWTLFRQPVPISHNQLEAFRALNFLGKKPMVNNFRPVQALNGRQIRCNF
ncbi:carbonic anhydrase 2-like isoform X2 [Babylonia areolata]|uniref:carbonic anhydrase 2-like isoform X2 n=1 Tax=Babylonia areolata TaxID=304850 RepID=UPI003FD4D3C3